EIRKGSKIYERAITLKAPLPLHCELNHVNLHDANKVKISNLVSCSSQNHSTKIYKDIHG
ncbi:unnamed protein product, partial [Sphenostylis stenocarpa]